MTLQDAYIGVDDMVQDKEKHFPSLKKAVDFIYESDHKTEMLLFFGGWNADTPAYNESKEAYYQRMKESFHKKFDRY